MDSRRLAPTVGIVACALVLVVLAVPYALVDAASAVGTYYGTGAVNPLVGGLLALVTIIVLAAGREERTDPALAAGVGLTVGLFVLVLSTLWAATVPMDVVVGMSTNTLVEYHRFALVAVAAVIPVSGAWYARGLGLL